MDKHLTRNTTVAESMEHESSEEHEETVKEKRELLDQGCSDKGRDGVRHESQD